MKKLKTYFCEDDYMKFGIGAIFKDELDYILEWLAWHRIAGFSKFFIADNGSIDGTRELLESLEMAGLIDLIYISPQPKAQLLAYNQILNIFGGEVDAIAFIDADEFIFSDDKTKPVDHLRYLFSPLHIGAVGINWRIFGSSGKEDYEEGLVVERFVKCAENDHQKNRYMKQIVRPSCIKTISVHHSDLIQEFQYIDCKGNDVIFTNEKGKKCNHPSGCCEITESPLRIHHYIVKSRKEYIEKKQKRGDAMVGHDYNRGDSYFLHHDLNDCEFNQFSFFSKDIYREIKKIKSQLIPTGFYDDVLGSIGKCNSDMVGGWAFSEKRKIKILIFVNGEMRAAIWAINYRIDLIQAGISKHGFCGFHHNFNPPLNAGDVVHVSVYANPFKFPQRSITVIE